QPFTDAQLRAVMCARYTTDASYHGGGSGGCRNGGSGSLLYGGGATASDHDHRAGAGCSVADISRHGAGFTGMGASGSLVMLPWEAPDPSNHRSSQIKPFGSTLLAAGSTDGGVISAGGGRGGSGGGADVSITAAAMATHAGSVGSSCRRATLGQLSQAPRSSSWFFDTATAPNAAAGWSPAGGGGGGGASPITALSTDLGSHLLGAGNTSCNMSCAYPSHQLHSNALTAAVGAPPQPGSVGSAAAATATVTATGTDGGAASPAVWDPSPSEGLPMALGCTAEWEGGSWLEVVVSGVPHPSSPGEVLLLVVQHDVSARVWAERQLARVVEAEHTLLESIFPQHVLEHIATMAAATTVNTTPHAGEMDSGDCRTAPPYLDPSSGAAAAGPGSPLAVGGMPPPQSPIRPTLPIITGDTFLHLSTSHSALTVLFCDIQGFTAMCNVVKPATVMAFLNDLYTRLDAMLDAFGVYKVETIGDCYMVAGGLMKVDEETGAVTVRSDDVDPQHAYRTVQFSKALLRAASAVRLP
ncbi:hypothetical protein Agub_g10772, partial [Astrephomene gubernaculifera]